jgi:hypothetical protein
MVMEPPSGEIHILERCNGTIVIGKSFRSDVESEHGRMPHRYIDMLVF